MSLTQFSHDGPCCGASPGEGGMINYTDNGNTWVLQGDIEPGAAWASANASGLTLISACDPNDPSYCGPHNEFWGDHEAFDDVSIYGDLGGIPVGSDGDDTPAMMSTASSPFSVADRNLATPITSVPSNATVFSAQVYIPYYNYFSSCKEDTGSGGPGCTYELYPYDSATLGFDVAGNYDIVSIAEICGDSSCTTNALQMSAYTSSGGGSVDQVLNSTIVPTYTPQHKLTIATDRRTFVDFYVDNILLFSSSTMPIEQNPSFGGVLEFSIRTSINNETDSVTFSNITAYSSSHITASGLSNGMSLIVNGVAGFSETALANSDGMATVDVSSNPSNLMVSVVLDGNVIANYSNPVNAGAEFKLT